jgi:NAD+ synthase (glutamine-hydrolysing)
MKIHLCQFNPIIGDLDGNTRKILDAMADARQSGADLVLTPELAITGYPPEDFLFMPHFIDAVYRKLDLIIENAKGIAAVIGLPRSNDGSTGKALHNSAAVIVDGRLLGFQDKMLLPTYDVFDERRYFEPGDHSKVWEINGERVVITICEDIWMHSHHFLQVRYPKDPIEEVKSLKPDILLNLSSSPFSAEKVEQRIATCKKAALSLQCPIVLCNQVGGNDSLIFDGHSVYIDAKGRVQKLAKGFAEQQMMVDTKVVGDGISYISDPIRDLYHALVLGLRDYFHKSGFRSACLGLSGGIDSAVVACIAVDALGKDNVLTVNMPSRYSSEHSITDSRDLADNLGVGMWSIPIEKPFTAYLDVLDPFFEGTKQDHTEENLQARIRGMIMMAISNKFGHVVLSTGNKSEMAVGYATLYGDMCGGLGIISDVTKREVYALARWINRDREIIPENTITKPPSAELRPNQKDSDSLPEYDILDNVLQAYVVGHKPPSEIASEYRYPLDLVIDIIRKIHRNEYKRRQSAPGLRVSQKSFSVGRRFPIVQKWV